MLFEKEEKMKNNKNGSTSGSVAIIVALIAMCIVSLYTMYKKPNPPVVWWNLYSVTDTNKDSYLEISETQVVDRKPERMVEVKSYTNILSGISGHDLNMDGVWDEIFWCGYDANHSGANAYVRTKNDWKYVPCGSDKKAPPIPKTEVAKAIKVLDAALTNRTFSNLQNVWTWNSTTDLKR